MNIFIHKSFINLSVGFVGVAKGKSVKLQLQAVILSQLAFFKMQIKKMLRKLANLLYIWQNL